MNENELVEKLLQIFPNMELGEDNDGQLIIYTDCELTNGIVTPYKEGRS